jgi:hypothetical protein
MTIMGFELPESTYKHESPPATAADAGLPRQIGFVFATALCVLLLVILFTEGI